LRLTLEDTKCSQNKEQRAETGSESCNEFDRGVQEDSDHWKAAHETHAPREALRLDGMRRCVSRSMDAHSPGLGHAPKGSQDRGVGGQKSAANRSGQLHTAVNNSGLHGQHAQ